MSETAKPKLAPKPWTTDLQHCDKTWDILNQDWSDLALEEIIDRGIPTEMLAMIKHPNTRIGDGRILSSFGVRLKQIYSEHPSVLDELLGRYYEVVGGKSAVDLFYLKTPFRKFARQVPDKETASKYLHELMSIQAPLELMGVFLSKVSEIEVLQVLDALERKGQAVAGGTVLVEAKWRIAQKQEYVKACWDKVKEAYRNNDKDGNGRRHAIKFANVLVWASRKQPEALPEEIWNELPSLVGRIYAHPDNKHLGTGIVSIIQNLPEASVEKWQAIYQALKVKPKNMYLVLENPNVPVELGRAILNEHPSLEIRLAAAKNKKLRLDKEIRQKLLSTGRTMAVWRLLIASSTDPEEGARILGYMADTSIWEVRAMIANKELPEGVPVPDEVIKRCLMADKKEQRIAIIGQLGGLTRSKEPLAPLPEKGKTKRLTKNVRRKRNR